MVKNEYLIFEVSFSNSDILLFGRSRRPDLDVQSVPKAFKKDSLIAIRMENHAIIDKLKFKSLYASDNRRFRR